MELLFVLFFGLFGVFVYFIPAFMAIRRRHTSAIAISFLNLTFGWTGIFWLVSLVLSMTQDNREKKPETVDDSEQF